jgi:hypothetical protein
MLRCLWDTELYHILARHSVVLAVLVDLHEVTDRGAQVHLDSLALRDVHSFEPKERLQRSSSDSGTWWLEKAENHVVCVDWPCVRHLHDVLSQWCLGLDRGWKHAIGICGQVSVHWVEGDSFRLRRRDLVFKRAVAQTKSLPSQ